MVKRVLSVIGVIFLHLFIMFLATIIFQLLGERLFPFIKEQIIEYSGAFGTVVTAVFAAFFLRAKGISKDMDVRKERRVSEMIAAAVLSVCIVPIVADSLVGILFNSILPIEKEEIPDDERKRYLAIIEQQIEAANVQLEDMLEYAKFGGSSYKIFPEEGNIAALLRGILADMFYRFEEKNLALKLEIPDKVICKYDREQMRRVFSNLINNAVRHNPESTVIKVTMTEIRGRVEIVFADNGPFLDEELKAHIFEPYMKGNNGGSGLGLSVAKRITELHGGMLEYMEDAESEFKRFVVSV